MHYQTGTSVILFRFRGDKIRLCSHVHRRGNLNFNEA